MGKGGLPVATSKPTSGIQRENELTLPLPFQFYFLI